MGVMKTAAVAVVSVTFGVAAAAGLSGSDSAAVITAAPEDAAPPSAAQAPAAATDCVLPAGGKGPKLDADQTANARAIIRAANETGVGEAGARIGVAAALVEGVYTRGEKGGPVSGLRNVPYGMGSSIGIFQELAGSGSGYTLTDRQRMDVHSAATRFFTKLKRVKGWKSMDPGAAAQAVQRSAYPTRYAKRMSEASAIVAALGGGATGCVAAAAPSAAPAEVAAALTWAASKAGRPYVWGGTGPDGWDCSGLTMRAFEKVGVNLPRTAEMQRSWLSKGHGTRIKPGQERPGDLLFSGVPAYHVVIVHDASKKRTIEARQTCRPGMKGAGIDCGVGHFDYSRRIAKGAQIWRVNQ